MNKSSDIYSVVFFSETNSPFGALHAAALRATRKFEIVAFVVSKSNQSGSRRRAEVLSARDFISRAVDKALYYIHFAKYRIQSRAPFKHQTPIITITTWDDGSIQYIKSLHPDIIFSSGHTRILPLQVIELAPLGAYNTHPSALPAYGGSNPWFWILLYQERVSGVTIHKMVADVDAGDVVVQKHFSIPIACNYSKLYSISLRKSAGLVKVLARLIQKYGSEVPGRSQGPVSVFPVPKESDYKIDWAQPARAIRALVAASTPAPGAFSLMENEKVTILSAEKVRDNHLALKWGQLHCREADTLVGCGDGSCIRIRTARYRGMRLKGRSLATILRGYSGLCFR